MSSMTAVVKVPDVSRGEGSPPIRAACTAAEGPFDPGPSGSVDSPLLDIGVFLLGAARGGPLEPARKSRRLKPYGLSASCRAGTRIRAPRWFGAVAGGRRVIPRHGHRAAAGSPW